MIVAMLAMWAELAAEPARVHVYAQRGTEASSWMAVFAGSEVAAELKEGRFFTIQLPQGRVALAVEKGVPVFLDLRGGEDAFVRLDWNFEVRRKPVPVLAKVDGERARLEMRFLSYVDAKRVKSARVAKADLREPDSGKLKIRKTP